MSSILLYACSVAAVSWLLYKLLIEPFLSPLRKIPGCSYNPIFGNMREIIKGETMEASTRFIEKYGPLYRFYFFFGRERLAVADPAIMKRILSTNSRNYQKPPRTSEILRKILGNGLVVSEGADHTAQKRLMSPAFNQVSITNMIPTFQRKVENLVSYWMMETVKNPDNPTNEVSVYSDVSKMTLDVIGETAFGFKFDSVDNPESAVAKAFNAVLADGGPSLTVMIPHSDQLPTETKRTFDKNMKLIRKTVDEVIQEKRVSLQQNDGGKPTTDCLSAMMKAEEGNKATNMELRDQVLTLMMAGHETTSTAMTFILLNLTTHPEVQQKCYDEIMSVFGDETDVTWERIESLHYCNNVIKETMRLHPPVPVAMRKNLKDDIFLDKYHIPKNTHCVLLIGAMMRRPDLFKDPLTFNPDRFDDIDATRNFYQFLPFLIGPRMCIGHKFAMAELATMMVGFFRNFTFEKVPGYKFKLKAAVTMRPDPPLKVRLRRRDQ